MSYQVLARKWRPQFFKDMVGQEHVMRALINALDNQRLHHAYLFTGTRGVGKTTIARILAKCLNCEQGITSEPCGECNSCQEITQGRFVDLIEVDAASRTKVEDTREILDNVQYAPTRGRYKVYLIDEVHMLSNSSFNALLKTLEEPPEHVKFLLATTDPQKLPATILSRCLQFSLKNMTPERIVSYLKTILGQENIPADEAGLWLLGRAAEGSMRDALSLTDQAISYGQGHIKELDVASMLGTVDRGRVFQLAIALAEADAASALELVGQMAEHAVDFNNLLADLIYLIHRIAIAQAVPDAVDNSQGDKEQVLTLAQAMSPAMVQLMYQVALTGKRDLPLAPEPRSGMEMTLLRMINFAPVGQQAEAQSPSGVPQVKKPDLAHLKRQIVNTASETSVPLVPINHSESTDSLKDLSETTAIQANEPAALQNAPSDDATSAPVEEITASLGTPVDEPQSAQSSSPSPNEVDVPWDTSDEPHIPPEIVSPEIPLDAPALQQVTTPDVIPVAEQQTAVIPEKPVQIIQPEPAPVVTATTEDTAQIEQAAVKEQQAQDKITELKAMALSSNSWPLIFEAIPVEGMLRNLVANTCLMAVNGDTLIFHSDAGHMRLFGESHQKRFAELLNTALDQRYQVQVIEGDIQYETPAQRIQRLQQERLQQAIDSIEQDPNVQALRQSFNAQVIMDSITPVD
ncbi:DNA polymerase III subunit gamma/tau [Oceaniserpentilla sp. 4NH20-0058]|uniref:DNA polymerase III subunit gamma/tau n=1 Tax=Oceaniserpentilla sp. 4NH20-0058 TaxID=3127660 RepID=UPI00333EEA5C